MNDVDKFKLGGSGFWCGNVLVPTTGTSWGYSYICLGAGLDVNSLDQSFGIDLGFEQIRKFGKLMPAGGEGTKASYDSNLFRLNIRSSNKDVNLGSDGRLGYSINRISGRALGGGWSVFGSDRNGGGASYHVSGNDSWPVLFFETTTGYGLEIYFGDLYLQPEVLFRKRSYIPLVNDSRLKDQAFGPLDLGLEFKLNFGGGVRSDDPTREGPPSPFANTYAIIGDVLEMVQRGVQLRQDRLLAKGNGLLNGAGFDAGGVSQQTEDLGVLYLFEGILGGVGMGSFAEEINASYKSEQFDVYGARLGIRGAGGLVSMIGGFVAGKDGGGESLLASGTSDLFMLADGLFSMSDMDPRLEMGIGMLLGSLAQTAGTFMDNKGLMMGGTRFMVRQTFFPDAKKRKYIKSTEVALRPYNKILAGPGNATASIAVRSYVDSGELFPERDEGMYVEMEAETHALYPPNIGKRVSNAVGEPAAYDNIKAASKLRTGLGVKKNIPLKEGAVSLSFAGQVYSVQQFSGGGTAGGGVSGEIGVGINLTEDVKMGFSGRAGVEILAGQKMTAYAGPGLSISWK
ncbi:MAG: hypothetical protein COV46_08605 [Deltaproteobacteria bacterium CG11_big_fil_rev_8_21_14_0_20_49_13]|nr:MAG: hypothetical protein COV46_08605 [Deltaproteobacteria bacterium CG11_big_fil_rev_8_21_14_0_20_49_13]